MKFKRKTTWDQLVDISNAQLFAGHRDTREGAATYFPDQRNAEGKEN